MDESVPPLPYQSLHRVSPLRIGLLVDSVLVSPYVYDFVEWARSHKNIVITHLILHPRPESRFRLVRFLQRSIHSINTNRPYFHLSEWALRLVERLEEAIIQSDKHHSRHLQQ